MLHTIKASQPKHHCFIACEKYTASLLSHSGKIFQSVQHHEENLHTRKRKSRQNFHTGVCCAELNMMSRPCNILCNFTRMATTGSLGNFTYFYLPMTKWFWPFSCINVAYFLTFSFQYFKGRLVTAVGRHIQLDGLNMAIVLSSHTHP